MDQTDIINKCKEVLESITIDKGKKYVEIPYKSIIEVDPYLSDTVEENYSDFVKCMEITYQQTYNDEEKNNIQVIIKDLPKSMIIPIGEIRKEHINKFAQFEGTVIKTGDIKVIKSVIRFECSSCGNIISVLQGINGSERLRIPTSCGCGAKNRFREISCEWKNVQFVVIEENITDYTTKKSRPTIIKVLLEEHLTHESLSKKIQPGKHIIFTGQVVAKQADNPKKNLYYFFQINASFVEIKDINLFNMCVPEKYIKQFKNMDTSNVIHEIYSSLFNDIEGYDTVKEILAVSRARAVKTYHDNGSLDMRDTIYPLLISSPGTGKTELCKRAISIEPISLTVSGKASSGVGLTGSVLRDPDLGCFVVEPGAIVRTSGYSLFLDELDKVDDQNLSALNEAMTSLAFTIAKANQIVTLQADCNLIGALNPEGRKWDLYAPRYKQIPLKPDFMDRFDIWIGMDKIGDPEGRKKVIGKMIGRFNTVKKIKPKYNIQFIQYYYAYIIQNFKPCLTDEAEEYAKHEISKLMNNANSGEKSTEVSYRLVSNIIRFSIAIAKMKQQHKVTIKDIDKAISYQIYGLKSLEMVDESTGKISQEKINFQTPAAEKKSKYVLIEAIEKMYDKEKRGLLFEEVMELWKNGGNEASIRELDDMIDKLKMRGDLIENPAGHYRPIS